MNRKPWPGRCQGCGYEKFPVHTSSNSSIEYGFLLREMYDGRPRPWLLEKIQMMP